MDSVFVFKFIAMAAGIRSFIIYISASTFDNLAMDNQNDNRDKSG
jgi:hypothetical protein